MKQALSDDNSHRKISQNFVLQILLLLLFFYFTYSGAVELGILDGANRKFEGYTWLGKAMGIIEGLGALALIRPEGVLGGIAFLIVAMGAAIICSLANHRPLSAFESLLMFNVCVGIGYWYKNKMQPLS